MMISSEEAVSMASFITSDEKKEMNKMIVYTIEEFCNSQNSGIFRRVEVILLLSPYESVKNE